MFSLNILNKILIKCDLNVCKFVSLTSKTLFSNNNNDNSLAINRRNEAKIKMILNEYEIYKRCEETIDLVPKRLTDNHVKQLLRCHQMKRVSRNWIDLSSQLRRHLLYLLMKMESNDGKNQLNLPLMPFQLEKLSSNRLKNSSLFGQNIVFDISFDTHMSALECKNLAEQLYRIYRFNRYETIKYSSQELPFALNFCNVNKNDKTFQFINFLYPEMSSDESFINITSKSYLDLFPKQHLVYLSPHADQVLTEYDENDVFIIGGIVDRRRVITLSSPKASDESIRSKRLPIDSIVNKSNIQALDSVFKVLFDFKAFGLKTETIGLEKRLRKHFFKHKIKSIDQIVLESLKSKQLDEMFTDFNDYSCIESHNKVDVN